MTRLVLDAGAFVALDKGEARMRARVFNARKLGLELVTSAPVVAQVWRSARQANLSRALLATRIDAPDELTARRAGELLARSKTSDVVDALIMGLARDGDVIVTSDPDDLRRLADAASIKVTIVAP